MEAGTLFRRKQRAIDYNWENFCRDFQIAVDSVLTLKEIRDGSYVFEEMPETSWNAKNFDTIASIVKEL